MKELHFLLLFVLWTELKLECKANGEQYLYKLADAENKLEDEGNTLLLRLLTEEDKETLESTTPAEEEDKNDVQTEVPVERNENTSATLDWKEARNKLHASLRLVRRCARRFFPGLCSDPAHPVWAYSFTHQSCVEHRGCRHIYKRSNRFASHQDCMTSCKSLMDVYAHILAYQERLSGEGGNAVEGSSEEDDEDNEPLRNGKRTKRKSTEALENLISSVEEYTYDELPYIIPESSEGAPSEEWQRETPADIDSVPADYMDVQYDFNTNRYRKPRGG